jgi:hypothetical protein
LPGRSDEPGTSSVGPDWAVATLTIILGGPRPMSFDSCLMGTIISVPDSSLRACRGVGYSSIGFTVGRQGICSPGGTRKRTCSPRAIEEVGYFVEGFFVRGDLGVPVWLGGLRRLVIHMLPHPGLSLAGSSLWASDRGRNLVVVSIDSRLLTADAGSSRVYLPSLEESSWTGGSPGLIMGQGIRGARISGHWTLGGCPSPPLTSGAS